MTRGTARRDGRPQPGRRQGGLLGRPSDIACDDPPEQRVDHAHAEQDARRSSARSRGSGPKCPRPGAPCAAPRRNRAGPHIARARGRRRRQGLHGAAIGEAGPGGAARDRPRSPVPVRADSGSSPRPRRAATRNATPWQRPPRSSPRTSPGLARACRDGHATGCRASGDSREMRVTALDKGKSRPPHERAVAEDPQIVLCLRHGLSLPRSLPCPCLDRALAVTKARHNRRVSDGRGRTGRRRRQQPFLALHALHPAGAGRHCLERRLVRRSATARPRPSTPGLRAEARAGRQWTCADRQVGGYPFRIAVACGSLTLSRVPSRPRWAGSTSIAQVYQPGFVITEIEGPLRVSDGRATLEGTWDLLQSEPPRRAARPAALLPRRRRAPHDLTGLGPEAVVSNSRHLELHVRPNPVARRRQGVTTWRSDGGGGADPACSITSSAARSPPISPSTRR